MKAILYPTPPDENMQFPVGTQGEIEVMGTGIKWVPARRRKSAIEMPWTELLWAKVFSTHSQVQTYLFEIRTIQGTRWFHVAQLDEPVLKRAIGEHVEVEEAG